MMDNILERCTLIFVYHVYQLYVHSHVLCMFRNVRNITLFFHHVFWSVRCFNAGYYLGKVCTPLTYIV